MMRHDLLGRLGLRRRRGAVAAVDATIPRICVVTPVFNGACYLDDAIASVLTQAGDFVLHYHIQDGGSTDRTSEIIRRWRRLHTKRQLPMLCRQIIFTSDSTSDAGIYDAVNKGFATARPPGASVMMSWIAADDRLAAGALQTVCEVRRDLPQIQFFGGRIVLLNMGGCAVDVMRPHAFARNAMAAGLYDGRGRAFVMQEGTFWTAELWDRVGGLNAGFRLAGDWDLWRRIAAYADFGSVDALIGCHRKRPGQSSADVARYHAEIDGALAIDDRRERYDDIVDRMTRSGDHDANFTGGPYGGIAICYNQETTRWAITTGRR